MGSILIIEDDLEQLAIIERALRAASFETDYATDGAEGLKKALSGNYQLLIVDVNLPSMDGFSICRSVREKNLALPVMFLTGRADEEDKVAGFGTGGDDYVLKPFGERELAARAVALLRRGALLADLQKKKSELRFGELTINLSGRVVTRGGEVVDLTTLEFDLLVHLANEPGKVFSREELTESLWGYQCTNFGPSITAYFSRLRSKLEPDPKEPQWVKTVRGVGYKFEYAAAK